MNDRQIFKAAFISECINQGITSPAAIEKHAAELILKAKGLEKQSTISDLVGGAVQKVFDYGMPVAIATPPIIGGLIGATAGKLNDMDEVDVEQAKKEELIEELRRQTDRIAQRRSAIQYAKRIS